VLLMELDIEVLTGFRRGIFEFVRFFPTPASSGFVVNTYLFTDLAIVLHPLKS
jgi:hypothetical protein